MGLIDGKTARRMVAARLLKPGNMAKLVKLATGGKTHARVRDDAQLKLYAKMVPSGFLHYGYFDDPSVKAEEIGFADIERAQLRYAELLLDLARDTTRPVLDGGCGMGGLLPLLKGRGFSPVALTPDASQVAHVRAQHPDIVVEHCKFEELDAARYEGAFGTVINSESLQYIDLDDAIRTVQTILGEGGRWLVVDYFRTGQAFEKSGHRHTDFLAKVQAGGFTVVHEQDITANVLPTMAFAHLMGERLGVPLAEYIFDKIETKTPALHFLLQDVIGQVRPGLREQLSVVDPEVFARDKIYALYALERA